MLVLINLKDINQLHNMAQMENIIGFLNHLVEVRSLIGEYEKILVGKCQILNGSQIF